MFSSCLIFPFLVFGFMIWMCSSDDRKQGGESNKYTILLDPPEDMLKAHLRRGWANGECEVTLHPVLLKIKPYIRLTNIHDGWQWAIFN
ncbi:hypothetical protein Peur_020718 [Populus x canadensis]